jgi:3-oxoadipate enol-lactonase
VSFIEGRGTVHFYRFDGPPAAAPRARAPLVFVNALGTDHRIWDPLIEALPPALRQRAILSYDLRGQGLSALGNAPHTITTLVDDLAFLLDQLELAPAIVCGLSLGGLVAQALAASAPERVAALCLCATGLEIGAPQLWTERIAVVRSRGLGELTSAIIERWFSPGFRREQPALVRGYQTLLERNTPEGYIASLEVLRDTDLSAQAAHVRAPALVIAGESDVATPPVRVQRLAAALARSRYGTLPAAGHLFPIEQPEAVAEALAGFIEELSNV